MGKTSLETDKKKTVVFGAAKQGAEFVECFQQKIDYFFDNDEKKWNKFFCGIEVIEPIFKSNYQIIVANLNHDIDIVFQLFHLGYKKFSVIKFMGRDEFGKPVYTLDDFDYSDIENFQVRKNKVALLKNTNSGSNTYCLMYMIKNYYPNNSFEFKLLDETSRSKDYYFDIFTSNFIFLTRSFFSSKDKIIFQCFHAFPFKGTGYFDSNINETSFELTHLSNLNAKYILSTSTLYSVSFGACFGVPASKFIKIGLPRNDVLLISDGKMKMHEKFPITKNKHLFLYMPTYRERTKYTDEQTKGYIFLYPDFDVEKFNNFMQRTNSMLVIKMHPADNSMFNYLQNLSPYLLFLKESDFQDEDFYEYINACDALITDYSSIFLDYLLLDKPIIFSHRDSDLYLTERPCMFSPLSFWCPGPKVTTITGLLSEIENILCNKDYFAEQRHQITEIVHEVKDSNASKRIIDILNEEMKK